MCADAVPPCMSKAQGNALDSHDQGTKVPVQEVAPARSTPLSPARLLELVRKDYEDRCYFLTGDISDAAYDADCEFVGEVK
jgi:hypothetical protein